MKTKLIQKIKDIYLVGDLVIPNWSKVKSGEKSLSQLSKEYGIPYEDYLEKAISQSKEVLVEEIKKTIEKKKDDLVAQEKFCSNCIKERDEEDDELTGEIEPCQTHLISWFNIQTLEELLEVLNKQSK